MTQAEQSPRPLLIISDSPASSSGLGRICRDLAVRIHEHLGDVYRLGVYSYGSPGSRKFGFQNYFIEGMDSWVLPTLPEVCEDFFGKEKGIILGLWDPSRLTWLAAPQGCSELFTKFPGLQAWALSRPFELWGYLAVDASGPNDRLTFPLMKTLLGFDRILAYGQFGEDVIRRTIGDEEANKRHLTNLPHAIDTEVFYEVDRKLSRRLFLQYTGAVNFMHMLRMRETTEPIKEDEILISVVATNQSRKNWPLCLEACAILARKRKIRVWLHTNSLEGNFSLPNLLIDYGLMEQAVISLGCISDDKMAVGYSASDLFFGIGPEGWGFPCGEALACQTPVITGSYAGAADFVPREMQVLPIGFFYEGSYGSKRPVYNPQDWAAKAEEWIGKRTGLNPKYDWENNWQTWENWFREASNG